MPFNFTWDFQVVAKMKCGKFIRKRNTLYEYLVTQTHTHTRLERERQDHKGGSGNWEINFNQELWKFIFSSLSFSLSPCLFTGCLCPYTPFSLRWKSYTALIVMRWWLATKTATTSTIAIRRSSIHLNHYFNIAWTAQYSQSTVYRPVSWPTKRQLTVSGQPHPENYAININAGCRCQWSYLYVCWTYML